MLQVQVQARMDLNVNHRGRLLILREMGQYLRVNPISAKLSDLQIKYDDLQRKYDVTFIHNQHLIVDLSKCTEANMFHKNHEKEFKKVINTLKEDNTELKKTTSRKQIAIYNYINRLEEAQKELACVKCENEVNQLRLDSYSNSRCVLDHIIDIQKKKNDVKCIGYKKFPPPLRHNYTAMPDEEGKPHFEPPKGSILSFG
ncbi:hypothetical protein Hanom_Chr13g01193161 [Helianthus anomalus]